MSTLRIVQHILGFNDGPSSNSNPKRRAVDWDRQFQAIPMGRITHDGEIVIGPLQQKTIFDGTRTLTHDGTTEYSLELSTLDPVSRYRLAWTGTGTAPGFRTDRSLALAGGDAILVLNTNRTLTLTSSLGAVFGSVQTGDIVHIPGTETGDSGPFNDLNVGDWTVLSATNTTLVLERASGTVFQGATETVAVTDNDQVQAYSSSGVQVGDTLSLAASFSTSARHTYMVEAVTATLVEFISTLPVAEEEVVPGAQAVKVFSDAKKFVHIETNQEIAVRLNGDTSDNTWIEPFLPANSDLVGFHSHVGTVYSLTLVNRTTSPATVSVTTAESA